jgi:hypothetical protein
MWYFVTWLVVLGVCFFTKINPVTSVILVVLSGIFLYLLRKVNKELD